MPIVELMRTNRVQWRLCSFYDFPGYFSDVIIKPFLIERVCNALADGDIKVTDVATKARLAVSLLSERFDDPKFAGALRAAVKLGLPMGFEGNRSISAAQ